MVFIGSLWYFVAAHWRSFLVFWRVIEIRSFRRTVFTPDVDFPQHVINLCSHKMCELLDSPLKVEQCTVIGRENSSFQFLVNRL